MDDVKAQLAAEGLDFVNKLPAISTSVDLPVANVQYLVDARQGVKLLNTLALVLPILALLCFAGAIALSRNRRRTLIWSALLVSAACVLIGLSLTMGRAAYLQAIVSPTISEESASVVFDTVVRFLRNGIRVFFFLGLIVAASAAITGDGAWAIKLRRTVGGVVTQGGEKSGLNTGAVGAFFAAHRTGYRVGTVAVFGLALFMFDRPTPSTLLWLVVGLLVVLAVFEFLAATAPRDDAESDEPAELVDAER